MVEIPPEIWLEVAQHIPWIDLYGLLSVNSSFFHLAMDARWNQVVIKLNDGTLTMLMKRLSDPFVARRVQCLVLYLDFNERDQPVNENYTPLKSCRRNRQSDTFEHVVDVVVAQLPHLVNVNNLNVNDLEVNTLSLPQLHDLRRLFATCWASFGANLVTLSLRGSLQHCTAMIESHPTLDSLHDLRLDLKNSQTSYHRVGLDALDSNNAILGNVVAPFINGLKGKLEALILLFEIDLSNLFSQLSSFPLLRNLEIHTPFIDILRDPSSLERFLFRCSHTIQRLVIHLTSLDEALTKWLSNCAADGQCYSRLQTLIFYPTHQAARVDVVLGFIRFTSTTLTELQVNQRSLTDDEAMIVVNALVECSQLTSLHLNISRFSLALLDNLAVKVPGIKSLSLSVLPDWHGGLNGLVFEELKERSYIEWKVENLSIWLRGRPVNHPTMEAFARCIPSVSSFFETGHIWDT